MNILKKFLSLFSFLYKSQTERTKQTSPQAHNVLTYVQNEVEHADLQQCFQLHKLLAKHHFTHNRCLCPDKFGVFRTTDIETMDESEVFLGNTFGLWTFSLPYWMSCKDEDAVEIVTKQYRSLIKAGIDIELEKLLHNPV